MTSAEAKLLIQWYQNHKRDLPWRRTRDAYRVWISESMLQQTTTTAVLGFYDRFLDKFPTLYKLSEASLEEVFEKWAGLGYYSRARNLHKAAQELVKRGGFPKTYIELMQLPGFGPYTARAVSSLAFSEKAAVLDGNVIRVICRKENLKWPWWQSKFRDKLQKRADDWLHSTTDSSVWNQAVMELGAQICLPKNPQCTICPWLSHCKSRRAKNMLTLPLKKPRKDSEIWLWRPHVRRKKEHIQLIKNNYAPFLQESWFLPGEVKKLKAKPKSFQFRHHITHYDIYVQIDKQGKKNHNLKLNEPRWVKPSDLQRWAPSSLIQKVLKYE